MAMEVVQQAQEAVDLITKQIPTGRSEEVRNLRQETKAVQDTLTAIMNRISPARVTGDQRAKRAEYNLRGTVTGAMSAISDGFDPLSDTQKRSAELAEIELNKMLVRIDDFFTNTWPPFKELIQKSQVSPFKDKPYSKLSW
jgi:hypothetical protein